MDGRNFSYSEAPKVEGGQYLKKMYDLQMELLEGYLKIEGLPRWPLNINSRKSQVILKDFAARVPEELAEGYESTHEVINIMKEVDWNINLLEDDQSQMIKNHIQNSNEELADAMGFFLGLLIYSGIAPSDFNGDLDELMTEGIKELNSFLPIDKRNLMGYNLVYFADSDEYHKFHESSPGFNHISSQSHEEEAKILWQIQYHLGVARNYLKNKPWKQSEELSDEQLYFYHVKVAFLKMLGYARLMGIEPEDYYRIYWKKNQTNKFRQKSHY